MMSLVRAQQWEPSLVLGRGFFYCYSTDSDISLTVIVRFANLTVNLALGEKLVQNVPLVIYG